MNQRNKNPWTRRVSFRTLAACLLCALLLTGCVPEEPEEPDDLAEPPPPVEETGASPETRQLPAVFSLPWSSELTLDPITCPDGMQEVVASLLCEGLFRLNTTLEPVTCLCDSYACDASGKSYTIVLKSGVTFSDGTPLTADAVKASLDRARDSKRYASRLRQIENIRAAGDTLFLTLYTPNHYLAALLDVPVCRMVNGSPVGTGPYKLTREEGGVFLTANETWWKGGARPVDRIRLVESKDALLYRFTSRDVQLVETNLLEDTTGTLTGAIRFQDTATTEFHYLACNVRRDLMNSEPFRKALSLGIDRAGLAASVMAGHVLPAQFPVSPACSLYPKSLETAYSLDAFHNAVKKSGYQPTRTLTLLVNRENSFKTAAAEAIAKRFAEAGIAVKVTALDWEAYQEAVANREFDLCYCETKLTADWNLSPLMVSGGALNIGDWGGSAATSAVTAYAAAEDRAAAMETVCTYVKEHMPFIPLWFENATVLSASDVVENLVPTMREPLYNLSDCEIHLRETAGTE